MRGGTGGGEHYSVQTGATQVDDRLQDGVPIIWWAREAPMHAVDRHASRGVAAARARAEAAVSDVSDVSAKEGKRGNGVVDVNARSNFI